jgi:magnesium transporter
MIENRLSTDQNDDEILLEQLLEAIESESSESLVKLLDPLSLSDELRIILLLKHEEIEQVFSLLPPEFAARLVNEAPTELAADLVESLEIETAAGIIDELGSDIQADVIGDLETTDSEAILAEMDQDSAEEVRKLLSYDSDTAGGLMSADAFSFLESDSVGEVLRRLASDDEDFERFRGQHPYILDSAGRPVGVVSLRNLLTAKRNARLPEIMVKPMTVSTDATIGDLQAIFDRHPFLGLPVVESDGKLVGTVSRFALDEAVLHRTEAQSLARQGVIGDELRSMPVYIRSRRRLVWLSANIVLNIIAASVIAAYEETLAAVIAIAIFLPMVSDMSGCSGNQAVAVSMRELSLGLAKPVDAFRIWIKEMSVGLINGLVLGLLIGIVAWIWKGNPYLGLVIGLALAINTIIAVSIGGVVPLMLKRFGQDPAVASGPLLTTITDIAGFFLVLSLAAAFMPLLK